MQQDIPAVKSVKRSQPPGSVGCTDCSMTVPVFNSMYALWIKAANVPLRVEKLPRGRCAIGKSHLFMYGTIGPDLNVGSKVQP